MPPESAPGMPPKSEAAPQSEPGKPPKTSGTPAGELFGIKIGRNTDSSVLKTKSNI